MADIHVEVVHFDTPTSTGVQSYTTSNFAGGTPKAAIVILTGHVASNDPSGTANARLSVGFTDGTNQWYSTGHSRSGTSTTGSARTENSTQVAVLYNPSGSPTFPVVGGFSAFITNGISIDWTVVDASNSFRGYVILFGGTDLSAHVGNQNMGTGTSPLTISSVGFAADVVFGAADNNTPGTNTASIFALLGIAANDGVPTQKNIAYAETSGVTGGRPAQVEESTKFLCVENDTSASVLREITIGNFTSSGFDLTPSASWLSRYIGYLALKFGGGQFKLWGFDTPISTGNISDTAPGFTPSFGLILGSSLEAVDTPTYNNALAGGFQISAFSANDAWAAAYRTKQGANPTDTGSDAKNVVLGVPSDSAFGVVKATLSSFDATGWTLNYSAVGANAKKAIALAVQGVIAAQPLVPSLVTNSQTFYAPTIQNQLQIVTPALFSNSQTFYAPVFVGLLQILEPGLFTNAQTFYAPTIAGTQVKPPLFTNTQTFYAPAFGATANFSPGLFTEAQTFYAPTVTPGAVNLSPALFANSQVFYTTVVTEGVPIAQEPVLSLMRDTPVPASGAMADTPLPTIGAMTNELPLVSLMRDTPVATEGQMSDNPVAVSAPLN